MRSDLSALAPSAYVDTFARDNLPPVSEWPTLEFTTADLTYPDRLNAGGELIDRPCEIFGRDRVALRTTEGDQWTYGELQTRANQIAQVLTSELGLVPGNRVLLRSPNNPWTVAAWLGVLKAGGIAVTTFAALRARDLSPIVEKTRPDIALVDHRFVSDVREVAAAVAPLLQVVTFGSDEPDDLAMRVERYDGAFDNVVTAADDVALLCATSGSTGVPKITMHFHRDVLSIDNTFGKHILGLGPRDLVACTAPFAFTFGLGMLVVFPLRAGAAALLAESLTPPELADAIAEYGVTVLATAPTAYKQIIRTGKLTQLKGLRAAVSAGEHIPRLTWRRVYDELGLAIIDGIGGTELLHIFISAGGDDIREGSTGRVVPGYRAAVLGPDGEEQPAGVPGSLAVIGPIGCRYLNDDRQGRYVVGGWNVTGDSFVRDEDGYFWYQARTDNMIVSSGYNIGGPEVEAAIDEHPNVVESAVVAAPDAVRGSVVCAFVVLSPGTPADAGTVKDIQDYVKRTLAPYKYPRQVRFVDSLPRNTSGKIQHFHLRRVVEAEAEADAESHPERTDYR